MTTAPLDLTLADLRAAAGRLRLTVVEDAPDEPPRPVLRMAEIVTDLADLADATGEEDAARLRRESHRLLLDAQAWPLLADLTEVARTRGDGWPRWLETVWLGLRDLGAVTARLDLALASRTDGQGRS